MTWARTRARRPQPRPAARCDWPMWGYSVERPFATELRERDHRRRTSEQAPAALVLQLPRRGHRDARGRRRHASTSATGPAASTRCGRATGSRAGRSTPSPSGSSTAARSSGRPRSPTSSGVRTVFVPSGKTMYALRASDGKELWRVQRREAGRRDGPDRDRVVARRRRRQGDLRLRRAQLGQGLRGRRRRGRRPRPGSEEWKLVTAPSDRPGAATARPARAAATCGAPRRSTASAGS